MNDAWALVPIILLLAAIFWYKWSLDSAEELK